MASNPWHPFTDWNCAFFAIKNIFTSVFLLSSLLHLGVCYSSGIKTTCEKSVYCKIQSIPSKVCSAYILPIILCRPRKESVKFCVSYELWFFQDFSVAPPEGKKKKAILNIALWKKTYVRQANENRTFQWLLHKTRHMYLERHMRIAHSLHSCATQNSHSKARLTMPHAFRIMWTHTGCQIIWAHTSTKKNTTNLSYLHPLQNKLYYLIQTTIEIHSYSF